MKKLHMLVVLYARAISFVSASVNNNRGKYLVFILFLSACSATPIAVEQTSSNIPLSSQAGKTVLVLPAKVTYQSVETGETLISSELDSKHNEELLDATIKSELVGYGLNTVSLKVVGNINPGSESDLLNDMRSNYRVLISPYKDKTSFLPLLGELSNTSGASLVCVTALIVEVGRGGGYEPLGGGSWHGTHSSLFKIALISPATGKHVWRSEVYVRKLPSDSLVQDSVKMMFSGS